jgi:hypothetical protein
MQQADENCFTGQLTSHIRSEFAEEYYDLYASISEQIRRVLHQQKITSRTKSKKRNHERKKIEPVL